MEGNTEFPCNVPGTYCSIQRMEGLKRIHLRRDVSPGNLLRYSIKQPIVAGFVSDETPQRELPYSL